MSSSNLTPELRQSIQVARDRIATQLIGYRPRPAQAVMTAEVARIASNHEDAKIALIEAQTGTGKSVAYLLGSVAVAKALEIPVVIASATIALQEQLALRDIPLFLQQTGIDARVIIAKGRRRYLCIRNLQRLTIADPRQIGLELGRDNSPSLSDAEAAQLGVLDMAYAEEAWDGDMDSAPAQLTAPLREALTTSSAQCDGRGCTHYWACPLVKARLALAKAQIVVTNQDLLLADLMSDPDRSILPSIRESILIVDEAHHLPRAAMEHFAGKVRPTRVVQGAIDALERAVDRAPLMGGSPAIGAYLSSALEVLQAQEGIGAVRTIESWLAACDQTASHAPVANDDLLLFAAMGALALTVAEVGRLVGDALDLIPKGDASQPNDPKTRLVSSLRRLVESLDNAAGVMACLSAPDDPQCVPNARWAELGDAPEFVIVPVSAGDMLRKRLFRPARSVVLTSATLTSMGTFARLREELGLETHPARELRLPSPFPLEQQAELVVPWMDADAKDAVAHTAELKQRLPGWLEGLSGGGLLLFASGKQMREVVEAIRSTLPYPVRTQGEAPTAELLAAHRSDIQAGRPAVLAGLASFSEGLDLPGNQCNCVVIAKIPFAVPDHPLQKARERWMSQSGRNYFRDVAIPEAFLRLVQACGRLIRTEADHGRILIADRRLVTTTYGRRMLEELPPFRRVIQRNPP